MDEIQCELPHDYMQYEPFMVGFLLDISPNYHDGKRVIDLVKDQLVQFVTSLEGEDRVYIFDGENTEIPMRHGKTVQDISHFTGVAGNYSIGEAMKVMGALLFCEGRDYKRVIFYITDRYHSAADPFVKEALEVMTRREFDCKVILVGIGEKYSSTLLEHGTVAFGLMDAESLKEELLEALKEEYGEH